MKTYKITVRDNGEEFYYFLDADNQTEAEMLAFDDYPNASEIYAEEV